MKLEIVIEKVIHLDDTVSYDVYLKHDEKEIRGYSLLNNVEAAFMHEPELTALAKQLIGATPMICNRTGEWPVWLDHPQEC